MKKLSVESNYLDFVLKLWMLDLQVSHLGFLGLISISFLPPPPTFFTSVPPFPSPHLSGDFLFKQSFL